MVKDVAEQLEKAGVLTRAFKLTDPERIPTGSLGLDLALGGGWPMERIVVLWGVPGTTKSTLCLWTIAQAQMKGKKCLYVDAEKSFTSEWAQAYGVDVNELSVLRSRSLDVMVEFFQDDKVRGIFDVIVIDSISSINTEKYFEENDMSIGLQARITKQLIGKMEYLFPKALVILISQSTVKMENYHPSLGPTGGFAMNHEAGIQVRLHTTRGKNDLIREVSEKGDKSLGIYEGNRITWKIEKSKVSLPWEEGQFRFLTGIGIDQKFEILELAQKLGVLDKNGGWVNYGESKWNGEAAALEALEDAALFGKIKDEVNAKIKFQGKGREDEVFAKAKP